jgi:glutathione S-transferase
MKLYYYETLNPRKACAVARYLASDVEFVRVDLSKGEQRSPAFLAINPNGKVPTLVDGGLRLWEANAIMCYLAKAAASELWPSDTAGQIDILRWLSWNSEHFTRHAGTLYFQHLIRPHLLGQPPDAKAVEDATGFFKPFAQVLNDHLQGRAWLLGDRLTVADFAIAVTLPYAADAKIPLAGCAEIERWHARLQELPAWREPFPAQPNEGAAKR